MTRLARVYYKNRCMRSTKLHFSNDFSSLIMSTKRKKYLNLFSIMEMISYEMGQNVNGKKKIYLRTHRILCLLTNIDPVEKYTYSYTYIYIRFFFMLIISIGNTYCSVFHSYLEIDIVVRNCHNRVYNCLIAECTSDFIVFCFSSRMCAY